jgi:hypothetical protein
MMSRRSSNRFFLSVTAALLLAGGSGFAITACSSSSTDAGATPDPATAEAGPDARIKVEAGPEEQDSAGPLTPEQCVEACNTMHPSSVAKETAIDTCWTASCKGPCLDDPPTAYDAGHADGGDAGADASDLCGTGVNSVTVDCDNCTQANCCPAWKGCFDDQDCSDLDDCIAKCFP